jgi:DNA-directed RNA polymerase subunit RPC12/RpoP
MDIVVLQRFETIIEANIARTKLDAYGVPCFLTEENVTTMTNHLLSGGIRLHVFARDEERARQIVMGDRLSKSDDGLIVCPRCYSRKIIRNGPEARFGKIMGTVVRILLGLTQPYYCQNCGHEFEN